jgi:Glutaredoxin
MFFPKLTSLLGSILLFLTLHNFAFAYTFNCKSFGHRNLNKIVNISPQHSSVSATELRLSAGPISSEQLGVVTMYKKEGCPYCMKARTLLEEKYGLRISFVDIESENRFVYSSVVPLLLCTL